MPSTHRAEGGGRVEMMPDDEEGAPTAEPPAPVEDRYAPDFKKEIADLFSMFDDCCTGLVDAMEIRKAAPGLLGRQLTDADDLHIFTTAELDNDGMLTYDEFAAWFEERLKPRSQDEHIEASFNLFEASNEAPGKITLPSVKHALAALGEPVPESRIEEVVVASSHARTTMITFDEYAAALKFETPDGATHVRKGSG